MADVLTLLCYTALQKCLMIWGWTDRLCYMYLTAAAYKGHRMHGSVDDPLIACMLTVFRMLSR